MVNLKYTNIIVSILLFVHVAKSVPVPDQFCTGEDNLYKFETGKEYTYEYETETKLWINDISDESASKITLKSLVHVATLGSCTYRLSLSDVSLTGESLSGSDVASKQLSSFTALFRLNQEGELDSNVQFQSGDKQWSRNVKRSIISVFQAKSESHLRTVNYLSDSDLRSATVYETDILGRCRTTYSLVKNADSIKLNKRKSLQRCTLNSNLKTSAVQYVPYQSLPEFFQGRLFIESFECNLVLTSNILNSVECKETSTYKIGSRGKLGAQAVVKQSLKLKESSSSSSSSSTPSSLETLSIQFEYDQTRSNELESANLNVEKFMQDICDKGVSQGLVPEHSEHFRDLVKSVRSKTSADLIKLYDENNARCSLAGMTVSHALLFADTDESFQAVLSLLDKDAFSEQKQITEYPILTALARNQNPSENLLNTLKSYIKNLPNDFAYLNKLYLIYSALVKTHCSKNKCSSSQLDDWSSLFVSNLADNCSNKSKKDLVVSSLKSIGNIGYLSDVSLISNCAKQQDNSLEVRVNAIQASRRFSCVQMESLDIGYSLLKDVNEDAEIRINAFLSIIRCSDESERFKSFAKQELATFLLNENDVQVLTYIIDYGKEHDLTSILNTVLNDPRIREKFSVNFKEISWNNYRFKYSVMRDSALEVDSSVIYTSKTFIPRSMRFNVTMHMFGMSINVIEATIRFEGLDEILKASLIDKLKSEKFLKRVMQQPEQLIELLNIVKEKLMYVAEKPLISLAIRFYGSDVYYSCIDNVEEFKKLAQSLRGAKENLYKQVQTIRNMLLIDSNVKQPLANGFEFETSFDVSSSLLVSKASTKEVASDDETNIEFDLNNFYSSSLSVIRRYDVQLDNENRLSLKKKSVFNGRLRMDIDGSKTNGSATYSLNLLPVQNLPLLTLDGRFYKLVNSKYNEIKDFNKVERVAYDGCTSERFSNVFGVNLCYSVQRPKTSLEEFIKYMKLEDVDQSVSDDDDEDDENELKRPSLLLSGPYNYKVELKNPNLIKTITFSARKTEKEFNAVLSTKSQQGDEKKTLEISYVKEKTVTNRGLTSKYNLELRKPSTNELKFQALSEFVYVKGEILAANFVLDSKIVERQFYSTLNFGRNKTDANIVPNYYLEALFSAAESKRRIFFNIEPSGRNIDSSFIVENSKTKLIDSKLTLKSNDEQNDVDLNYDLVFYVKTSRGGLLNLKGTVLATLLNSNIDLALDYSNPTFVLPKPGTIKLGHYYDGAAGGKSNVNFHVNAPFTPINHGGKFVFTYNLETAKFDYLELLVSKPGRDTPYSIFFERSETQVDMKKTTDLTIGLRDAQYDLGKSENQLLKGLIRVDDQEVLKSLILHLIRSQDKKSKKISFDLHVKKNTKQFVSIKYNLKGDLETIRKSTTEISKQEVGGDLYVKIMDNSGSIAAELEFESSVKNNKHKFDFEFKTENLFKMLFKIASIESEFSSENGKLDAKIEVQKVGDVKSFKIVSKGDPRQIGDGKEFNVDYEKKLANNQVLTGSGVARYRFRNFKNFESSISIPDHYESKMSLETKRTNTDDMFGFHSFKFSNKHLDGVKSEQDFNILVHNKTTSDNTGNTIQLVASVRRGDIGTLKNRDKLEVLFDLNADSAMQRRSLTSAGYSLDFKSKRFNMDLVKSFKVSQDTKTKTNKVEGQTKFKFPAIFTDPGKFNKLTHSFKYSRNTVDNEITFKNDYETDSKLFGRIYRVLNIDFSRQVSDKKVIKSNLNVDFKLPSDELNDKLKSFKMTVDHDYINFKINVKQSRFPSIRSFFKAGEVIDVSDCTVNTRYDRKKTESIYLLDTIFNLECLNRKLTSNKVYISRTGRDSDSPATQIELTTDSQIYYEIKSIVLGHEKFTPTNGLALVKLVRNKQVSFSNEFSYKRSIKIPSNKLETANYKWNSEVGSAFSKSCELNIDAKSSDYYNSANCRLNSSRVPNVELNYGYNLKAENPIDYLAGKRGYQLDVIVPGRTIRGVYKSNYATAIDGTDDDDDANNEREFNATATLQWNLLKEPSKLLTVHLKRDNFAHGKTKFLAIIPDHPNFKQLKFEIIRERNTEQTLIKTATSYELNNGDANRLDTTLTMNSDMDTNSFSFETNLQRPSLNTLYSNKYNKNNGRLQYLNIRLGKVLQLTVDKESDPEQRRISMQLTNPDENKFSLNGNSKSIGNGKYVFEASLNKNSQQISSLVSSFDSANNNFDVKIKGAVNKYQMNFGVFNETLANAHILNEDTNIVLGLATLQVVSHDDHNDLVLSAQWNRLWLGLQRDLLGESLETKAQENENFNSYFGDVYAQLSSDLKSSVDSFRKERAAVDNDLRNIFFIVLDTYSKYLPASMRNENRQSELKTFFEMQMANNIDNETPLYKRFFKAYNQAAQNLQSISIKIRKYSKTLSRLVPRLPIVEYNKEQITREKRPFDNNLVITRPTLYARNFYQFNAEYRDFVQKIGQRVLSVKRNLVRSVDAISLRGLINKYKYRSLKDYTLVANVYNKRNIIGFDGEQKTLQSKCRYLLAHETHKNRFSVVLNFNDSPYLISVFAYGQKSVDISYNKAAIDQKPISLPYTVNLGGENGVLTVTKTNVAICIELNHDLRVCCYEDSNSCTVATTRWFTGKINGLFGKANNNPTDDISEADWYLDSTCKFPNSKMKGSSMEAIKTCHATFGKHRKALFSNAIMAIRPNGWQKVCEAVLTNDPKAKCLLMKAFDHHADQEKVTIEAPNECFTCAANSKQYNIGQSISNKADSSIEKGSDYVFLTLPCDKSKYSIDLSNFVQNLKSKNSLNKYYVVAVDENDASVYQSDSSELSNYELKKALDNNEKTSDVSKENFNKALFLAASLFSKRLAQNRFLIIKSCGNCLPYSMFDTLKYAKKVTERNVIVHSWGDYNIQNLENDGSDDIPVGYDEENLYLYKQNEKTIDTDTLESYKIEHSADLCHRLAVKTQGSVLNINYLNKNEVLDKVTEMLEEPAAKFDYKIGRCNKYDTNYGDLLDFQYTRKKIESDE